MSQKEKIIGEYREEKITHIFDNERKKYLYQRYKHKIESNLLKRTIEELSAKKSKIKVLDVACGTGRMLPTVAMTNPKAEYQGLDSSESMTKHLKEKSKKLKFPIKLKIGDATNIPFKDNTFDIAYTFHLTWHLPQDVQKKIILEMLRVTKKNGYVIFDVLNSNFLWEKIKEKTDVSKTEGIYKMKIKDVEKIISGHKYEIEKLSDFPIKNSVLYSFANIINILRLILPTPFFHMLFFRVKK